MNRIWVYPWLSNSRTCPTELYGILIIGQNSRPTTQFSPTIFYAGQLSHLIRYVISILAFASKFAHI